MPYDFNVEALKEAMRRRMGQRPSAAGIPGGAPAANVQSPTNPLSRLPTQQLGGSMSAGPTEQLAKSQPGEAMTILKALINRWKNLGPGQ